MQRHLSQEARGCSHLVLWLDCDREGENICFEGNDFVCALTLLDNLLSKLQLNLLFFFFLQLWNALASMETGIKDEFIVQDFPQFQRKT